MPKRTKPLTCLSCRFDVDILDCKDLKRFENFSKFEGLLHSEGPWVAGIDFPFALPRKFIENINWPNSWAEYVDIIKCLSREEFRQVLDDYKSDRAIGDKEHLRASDKVFGGVSPQKQYGVPVALMLYEGAKRLLETEVNIPLLRPTNDDRIVFEAYPGYLARRLIGKTPYKSDTRKKQTEAKQLAREDLFQKLCSEEFAQRLGFQVKASSSLANDPTGDDLDSLLCAVQAAYALKYKDMNYGMPTNVDSLEGWIAGPT